MKRFLIILICALMFSAFADTYKIQLKGKAWIVLEEGDNIPLSSGDTVSDEDVIYVAEGSMVILYINGTKKMLREGFHSIKEKTGKK